MPTSACASMCISEGRGQESGRETFCLGALSLLLVHRTVPSSLPAFLPLSLPLSLLASPFCLPVPSKYHDEMDACPVSRIMPCCRILLSISAAFLLFVSIRCCLRTVIVLLFVEQQTARYIQEFDRPPRLLNFTGKVCPHERPRAGQKQRQI